MVATEAVVAMVGVAAAVVETVRARVERMADREAAPEDRMAVAWAPVMAMLGVATEAVEAVPAQVDQTADREATPEDPTAVVLDLVMARATGLATYAQAQLLQPLQVRQPNFHLDLYK